jgi:His-Xaa-Ser repeat protein HxsA
MQKFRKTLALFLASLPYLSTEGRASIPQMPVGAQKDDEPGPVDLRPLNPPGSNLFAAHRSHSSHSSHRSSSGGGYSPPPSSPPSSPPVRSQPANPAQQSTPLYGGQSSQPVDSGRPAAVSPLPARPTPPQLSTAEKLQIQVMRVQIALTTIGLYSGSVNGVLDDETKTALKRFQTVKGLPADGLMNTPTLNSLSVPAVQ